MVAAPPRQAFRGEENPCKSRVLPCLEILFHANPFTPDPTRFPRNEPPFHPLPQYAIRDTHDEFLRPQTRNTHPADAIRLRARSQNAQFSIFFYSLPHKHLPFFPALRRPRICAKARNFALIMGAHIGAYRIRCASSRSLKNDEPITRFQIATNNDKPMHANYLHQKPFLSSHPRRGGPALVRPGPSTPAARLRPPQPRRSAIVPTRRHPPRAYTAHLRLCPAKSRRAGMRHPQKPLRQMVSFVSWRLRGYAFLQNQPSLQCPKSVGTSDMTKPYDKTRPAAARKKGAPSTPSLLFLIHPLKAVLILCQSASEACFLKRRTQFPSAHPDHKLCSDKGLQRNMPHALPEERTRFDVPPLAHPVAAFCKPPGRFPPSPKSLRSPEECKNR